MKRYCLGIDIGGTSVKLGLFDAGEKLLLKWSIPTNTAENGRFILPELAATVNAKLAELGIEKEQLLGAGVGVPGQVEEDGTVVLAENLGWTNVPLVRTLTELTGLPVAAENDANLAALGELRGGSAKQFHSMVFITIGTGIGCGIVVKDKILSGADGAAGEIGHMHIEDDMQERCNCGKYGCLEQLASATGIVYLAKRELAASAEASLLRGCTVTAQAVFEAAAQNDALALRVVDRFGMYLGKALSICTCIVNPEVVVIGGGVSKAGQPVLDVIRKYYRRYAYAPCLHTEFYLAELGEDAGIYGGAKLAAERCGRSFG